MASLAGPAADDAGLRSMQAEGSRSLAIWDAMRRVFATATAPLSVQAEPG